MYIPWYIVPYSNINDLSFSGQIGTICCSWGNAVGLHIQRLSYPLPLRRAAICADVNLWCRTVDWIEEKTFLISQIRIMNLHWIMCKSVEGHDFSSKSSCSGKYTHVKICSLFYQIVLIWHAATLFFSLSRNFKGAVFYNNCFTLEHLWKQIGICFVLQL